MERSEIRVLLHDTHASRLKCLGYIAPLQALSNPPGPNTIAGSGRDDKIA